MRGARPGERRGGRQKGTRNKKTEELLGSVAGSGLTPMEFLLNVMRDEKEDMSRRIDAAKHVAPYVHPRLATIEHTGKDGGPIKTESVGDDEVARRIAYLFSKAVRP
jgi:hypothetical protein